MGNYIGTEPYTKIDQRTYTRTASEGQTVFNIPDGFKSGSVRVYRNGSRLHPENFNDTSGSNIQLVGFSANSGDEFIFEIESTFTVANTLKRNENLGDVPNKSTARDNLGLGSVAVEDKNTLGDIGVTSINGGTAFGMRNHIINGAMDIWQRGGSFNTDNTTKYTADRWAAFSSDSSGTVTQGDLTFTDMSAIGEGFHHSLKFVKNSASTYSGAIYTYLEDIRKYNGKKVVLSFYAKLNSGNFTSGSYLRLDFGSGGSSAVVVYPSNTQPTFVSGWARYELVFDIPDLSGSTLGPEDRLMVRITSQASDVFNVEFTGIQLEFGDRATPFEHRPKGLELSTCQRYYWRFDNDNNGIFGSGFAVNSSTVWVTTRLPMTMRNIPTVSADTANTQAFGCYMRGTNAGAMQFNRSYNITEDTITIVLDGGSGLTTGEAVLPYLTNGQGGWVAADAEFY